MENEEFKGQITFDDLLPRKRRIGERFEGPPKSSKIPFQELKDRIGQTVIIDMPWDKENRHSCKVVKITEYWPDHDCVYKRRKDAPPREYYEEIINSTIYRNLPQHIKEDYEETEKFDRVGYSDNPRKPDTANAWTSEMWAAGGKRAAILANPFIFYEPDM